MASWSAGGLDAVAVVDGECVEDGFPGVDPPGWVGWFFLPSVATGVERFKRGLLVGEVAPVAHGPPEPGIDVASMFGCADLSTVTTNSFCLTGSSRATCTTSSDGAG